MVTQDHPVATKILTIYILNKSIPNQILNIINHIILKINIHQKYL